MLFYIVSQCEDYEGCFIMSAHDTYEEATQARDKQAEEYGVSFTTTFRVSRCNTITNEITEEEA